MKTQVLLLAVVVLLVAVFASLSNSELSSQNEVVTNHTRDSGWRVTSSDLDLVLAKAVGLAEGDVVLTVNGSRFSGSYADWQKTREHCERGRPVSVVFKRSGLVHRKVGYVNLSDAKIPADYEFGSSLLGPRSVDNNR